MKRHNVAPLENNILPDLPQTHQSVLVAQPRKISALL